jgi:hypothetical protein
VSSHKKRLLAPTTCTLLDEYWHAHFDDSDLSDQSQIGASASWRRYLNIPEVFYCFGFEAPENLS